MSVEISQTVAQSSRRKFKSLRWWMLALFLLGVTVNYITRNSLGILAPELKTSLNMTTEQYSWVVASFQLAYTLFQPICGWLIDVIGLKMGFLICASIWAVVCMLHAGAGSWFQLAILRFFMGGAEAAATPANAKAISDWFPKKERPIAAGWAGVGFSIGAMLAPPIIVIAHVSFGWQGAFLFSGALAMIWVVLWWVFYHSPQEHPNLSQKEFDLINEDNEPVLPRLPFFKSLAILCKNKKFYGIAIPAFLAEPAWAVFSFWVPLYLATERGMDLKQIAMFAWLPFLAADIGSVASGYLTTLYRKWFGCSRVNSVVASSVTGAFMMVSLAFVAITKDPFIAIALISVGGFGHQVISCMLSALVVESFDKNQMATVNGMRGSSAWIASFLFTLLIGAVSDTIGFNPLFVAMGFFDLIGALFLIGLIAERGKNLHLLFKLDTYENVKNWTLAGQYADHVELLVDEQHLFCLYVLENSLFRVLVKRNGELALDRTWSIAPQEDVPWEGRDRLSVAGFGLPGYQLQRQGESLTIATPQLRVTVHQPLWLEWEYCNAAGVWLPLAADRPTSAYLLNAHGDGVAHYQRRHQDERYYGLGEKAGDLERTGRRFEMRNLDAMGYNAASTDPLYKHIPFTITRREDVSFGLFYDNLSSCWLDLGNEIDNYHLAYRRYQAEAGDLDYYMFLGPRVLDVTKAFVRLTGKTHFGPKWSLGYSGSTMHYTDAPDAQLQLQQFIQLCRQHAIPCDSFQLSSGYTSINNKRYVFNWNYDKVPQPKQLSKSFHDAGLKLAANIKPCLLQDHPQYQQVAEQGLFIRDSQSDSPERSSFWDDEGSHLDFTNPAAVRWWQKGVTEQLLEMGIDSTWNDNNEYEVWDGEARCHGFGKPIAIKHIRPVMPLLMMRASLEAQQKFAPHLRPYLISRSGCAGMQRYVQTWSGDNRTSWQTLRYNTRMGLGMSLSGLFNVGHDVGGFSGDKPDAELLVRWVQNGVMHPRFTIHSWNDDATVNEPWMYPAATPMIRDAINLRYQLMPYFYTLLWQASHEDEPMLRPTFLDHEHDSRTFRENDDFLIGRDLLVASVVDQGQRQREVYLPDNNAGWYCFYSGQWYSGGQSVVLDAPLERLPLLVRAGAGLPMSQRLGHVDILADHCRELRLFPTKGCGHSSGLLFEDDGESHAWQQDSALWLRWEVVSDSQRVELTFTSEGHFKPAWQELKIVLPAGETRELWVNGVCRDGYVM